MLFTPNIYTIGAVETITLSIPHNASSLIVDAELTYTECKCGGYDEYGYRIEECHEGDSPFSRDSGTFMNGKYYSQDFIITLFIIIFRPTCKAQLASKPCTLRL